MEPILQVALDFVDLSRALGAAAEAVEGGADPDERERWAESALRGAGFDRVDYVAVRDALTLGPFEAERGPGRVLAAAWLGKARLIDNVAL